MTGVWLAFLGFILVLLFLDLGVFHRKARVVEVREALGWSAVWIALGLSFAAFVYLGYESRLFGLGAVDSVDGARNDGRTAAIKYLTGYVVGKSLSVDNIFVIAMIFGFFAVPAVYQHRVLFWGIWEEATSGSGPRSRIWRRRSPGLRVRWQGHSGLSTGTSRLSRRGR